MIYKLKRKASKGLLDECIEVPDQGSPVASQALAERIGRAYCASMPGCIYIATTPLVVADVGILGAGWQPGATQSTSSSSISSTPAVAQADPGGGGAGAARPVDASMEPTPPSAAVEAVRRARELAGKGGKL